MKIRSGLWLLTLCLLGFAQTLRSAAIISTNSTWKFWKGTNELGSSWRPVAYGDSTWAAAPAPFQYGLTLTGGTALPDMRGKYSCAYFRKAFAVDDPAAISGLDINALCDDGMIVWINGVEVLRYNMPDGQFTFRSLASSSLAQPLPLKNFRLPPPSGYLVKGANVLAVQVFNNTLSGSDFGFDLELVAPPPDVTPPKVISISPPPGQVESFSQVTITFSEPVAGVEPQFLLINDAAAEVATGSGATYSFTFAQPPPGPVTLFWDPAQTIVDQGRPANAFDATGVQWNYTVRDLVPPTVLNVNPAAGGSVRSLSQVEVRFTEAVTGVDAADLLVNGLPATNVTGVSAGPYVFQFPTIASGQANFSWRVDHGIADLASPPNPFRVFTWSTTVDPSRTAPTLRINEIMASNQTGLKDEDGEPQDWIELFNYGNKPVDLTGLSLTDDPDKPDQWLLPVSSQIGPGGYLIVFTSGKDRRTAGTARPHTNFKLSAGGEYLGLYDNESPRRLIQALQPKYPAQRPDISYGLLSEVAGFRYLARPTPGGQNASEEITGVCPPVHFSVPRGFYDSPFALHLTCQLPGVEIRYTTDGSPPGATNGFVYTNALQITRTVVLRAAAFAPGLMPSEPITHTYLYSIAANRRAIPSLSLVSATNNLYGKTGIMESSPRNTTKHGLAWERPVSVELIRPEDNGGFHVDAGLRLQGGDYIRGLYNYRSTTPPQGKYSFRLYLRGDYGPSSLNYPLFGPLEVTSFDHLVLRAGMNDPTNPFIRDELCRRLLGDTGQAVCHGTFVNLFLNGVYKGYYNPTERFSPNFLQAWHGGGDKWDIIAQNNEVKDGDGTEFNSLLSFITKTDFADNTAYLEAARRLDMENFVDYLLVNIYAAMGDWPHNNWRAAREKVPGAKFRFYMWDGEWSFGFSNPVSYNEITNELERRETAIGMFHSKLKASSEFRLLFADRVHKHFFNDGALTDANVLRRFQEMRAMLAKDIPTMDMTIQRTWVPSRRGNVMRQLQTARYLASSNAPAFNQHGGVVPAGFRLTMGNLSGSVFYTTNGADPRIVGSGAKSPSALPYDASAGVPLVAGGVIKARSLDGADWSALTEAEFSVAQLGAPIRFTEIMYNPTGGDDYEFIELRNIGSAPVDLSFMSFSGITYSFPDGSKLNPGAVLVLASDSNPKAFAARYPGTSVGGHFQGSLSNGGERLTLLDRDGAVVTMVEYGDSGFWPKQADGAGWSLEVVDPAADPSDPANWRASKFPLGSPGVVQPPPVPAAVRLNEVFAATETAAAVAASPDWVEVKNTGASAVSLAGWTLASSPTARVFAFPAGIVIAPGSFLRVWCDGQTNAAGLHASFPLSSAGETVFLRDQDGATMDAVTFGQQVPGRTLARIGEEWRLGVATPEAENEAAPLGQAGSLRINEWTANAAPGADDWVELFNSDPSAPVALRGLWLSTSNAVSALMTHAFVPAGGYALLRADANPGTGHLNFKLPAAAGAITLYDSAAHLVDRVTYGPQLEGVSQGRYPNGASTIVTFVGTSSPGLPNYVPDYRGAIITEVMARAARDPATKLPGRDWIELYNPNSTAASLTGMSLSAGQPTAGEWVFPAGAAVPPRSRLVVYFDGSKAASETNDGELNTGHSIPGEGGGVYLFNADEQLVDRVEFGWQAAGLSIGREPGGPWRLLAAPTPGAPNAPEAMLLDSSLLRINEWMAAPKSGDDWIELYNPADAPVSLAGMVLTDDPSIVGRTNSPLPDLSFIGPRGFVRYEADGKPASGNNHLPFSLDDLGDTIRLYAASGSLVDSVDFAAQVVGVSLGRFPDGATTVVAFSSTASPEDPNWLPSRVVINEVLPHTDPPLEDAIELYNSSGYAVPIGGWYLSDGSGEQTKYRIPDGTVIPAGGFKVFYQAEFGVAAGRPGGFSLNAPHGDEVRLSEADGTGNLTGYRSIAKFPASENPVSTGRFRTSVGVDFVPLRERTFGRDHPGSIEEFHLGGGLPNAYPRVGPVVVNEIFYHPITLVGTNATENTDEEFVELLNITGSSTALFDPLFPTNTWRVRGGIEFDFASPVTLPAGGFLILVGFDPATNATARAAFVAKYHPAPDAPIVGPYRGKLGNSGDRVQLQKPDPPQTLPPEIGYVPYIPVETIDYEDRLPWPIEPDLGQAALQRRHPSLYGNDPLNWKSGTPSPGQPNADHDRDLDGLPDEWETSHQLDPDSAQDALADMDADGVSNLDEYLAGTDPAAPSSRLRLGLKVEADASVTIRFGAVPGRTYTVQYTDDPFSGLWSILSHVDAVAEPSFPALKDSGRPVSGQRFYRVVTPRQN